MENEGKRKDELQKLSLKSGTTARGGSRALVKLSKEMGGTGKGGGTSLEGIRFCKGSLRGLQDLDRAGQAGRKSGCYAGNEDDKALNHLRKLLGGLGGEALNRGSWKDVPAMPRGQKGVKKERDGETKGTQEGW